MIYRKHCRFTVGQRPINQHNVMPRVEKINEKVIVLIIDDNKNSYDKLVALMTRDKRQSVTGSGGLCVRALVRPQLSLYSVLMLFVS